MVPIVVPMWLHVFFGVPMGLAFQMTSDQPYRALHDGHWVAVGIGGDGVKDTVQIGGPS